jgi:hypothetical protein
LRIFLVRTAILISLTLVVFGQTPPARFSIQWDTNNSLVRVVGPISADVQKSDKLQEIFPVTVEAENIRAALDLPLMQGIYSAGPEAIEFRPLYSFESGISYRASFGPAKISSVLRVPPRQQARTTVVRQIYPTADVLPQNLLKFYLHFSAPMSRGQIYDHIHLLDQQGQPVELPFLEIDEELWNNDMTRLTLFLDPGRIKRGVRPLEEVGPALLPEKDYTLVIDDSWQDAHGAALKEPFRKKFRVTPPDRESPEPSAWKITVPKSNTREALAITFTDPMDEALALRMISVRSVTGQKSLEDHETKWLFRPENPWKAGRYEIAVQSTIEDLAGNNIGKPFEVDLEQGGPREPATTLSLRFQVE